MLLRTILMILFLFVPVENEDVTMSWDEERKLTWDDFKGPAKNETGVVAVTASGITFGFSLKQNNGKITGFDVTVEAHFYPDKSWYVKEKGNDHILAHEQLHFDITELHVRKLRYKISQLNINSKINKQLQELHEQANEDLRVMQERYDSESMNSIHKLKQAYWNTYIQDELDKYQEFQS